MFKQEVKLPVPAAPPEMGFDRQRLQPMGGMTLPNTTMGMTGNGMQSGSGVPTPPSRKPQKRKRQARAVNGAPPVPQPPVPAPV